MKKKVIEVFLGYQFESDYYTKDDLEASIKETVKCIEEKLQQEYKNIKLVYVGQEIKPFALLSEEIITKIKNSDIFIFELSYKNPNVYFELGYSLGLTISKYAKEGVSIVVIQNEKVRPTEISSDLIGRFLLQYKDCKDLSHKLMTVLPKEIINLFQDKKFLNRLIWGVYNEKVNIVCPYIPPKYQSIWGTLGELGDFNTVYELSILLSGILECEVKYYHSQRAEALGDELFDDHVIIVGGPTWNNFADRFIKEYNLPFKYELYLPEEGKMDLLCDEVNSRKYTLKEKTEKNKKNPIMDYGIFAKLPSRYNDDKIIVLVNGIETFGTLGAARAITYERVFKNNATIILSKVGLPSYFATLIETEISHNLFCYPKKILESNIVGYDPVRKLWEV